MALEQRASCETKEFDKKLSPLRSKLAEAEAAAQTARSAVQKVDSERGSVLGTISRQVDRVRGTLEITAPPELKTCRDELLQILGSLKFDSATELNWAGERTVMWSNCESLVRRQEAIAQARHEIEAWALEALTGEEILARYQLLAKFPQVEPRPAHLVGKD